MRCFAVLTLLFFTAAGFAQSIPTTEAKALDGHTLTLPRDLTSPTILLIGFSRKSADQTKLWQKELHAALSPAANLRVYDIAMLGSVPSPLRGMVTSAIRHEVPDAFERDFLVLTTHEPEWKAAAHFDPKAPDAAYVLLLNARGGIQWQTHEPYSTATLKELTTRTLSNAAWRDATH